MVIIFVLSSSIKIKASLAVVSVQHVVDIDRTIYVPVYIFQLHKAWLTAYVTSSQNGVSDSIIFMLNQVATALLVAGFTLTFWIPPFASTSLYSSVFQSARLLI